MLNMARVSGDDILRSKVKVRLSWR